MNKAIRVLKQEVKWHQDNKGSTLMSEDWEDGFIKGCEHCLILLIRCDCEEVTERLD